MKNNDSLTRREFTLQSALAMLSGVAITITACSDSGSPSSPSTPSTPAPTPTPSSPPTGSVTGTISANHGHQAVITGAQLTAGNAIELDITGAANHSHRVSLTADQVDQIGSGARVTQTSTVNSGHAHSVTFN